MKKTVLLFLFMILVVLFSACGNYKELKDMYIISAIGVDWLLESNEYELTAEIIGASGEKSEKPKNSIVSVKSKTLSEAFTEINLMSSGSLFFAHCYLLVLGDAMSKKGVNATIEKMLREPSIQPTINIVAAKDKTAKEILSIKPEQSNTCSEEITSIVKYAEEASSMSLKSNAADFYTMMLAEDALSYAPSISMSEENEKKSILSYGLALFKDGALYGYLDKDETFYRNFLINKINGGYITISPFENEYICALIIDSSSKTKVENVNGNMQIKVSVSTTLSNVEYINADSYTILETEKLFGEFIKNKCTEEIEKIKSTYGYDIFGFTSMIKDKKRGTTEDMAEIFSKTEIFIESKADVKETGILR